MAELAVRVKYLNQQRATALAFLRLTFPLWGVTAPIAAVIILIISYFQFVRQNLLQTSETAVLLSALTISLLFIIGMLTLNWLSHDAVEIDKDGVKLPFSLFAHNQLLRWPDIKKIMVNSGEQKQWHKKEIVFLTAKGSRRLNLTHIDADEMEKILLAMEMWGAAGTEIDQSLHELKTQVTGVGDPQLSFTGMWEEELSRRFCPTSFVPLDPGRVMRNGSIKVIRHLALGGLSAVYLCQLENRKLVVLKEAVVSDDAIESAQAKAREMLDREAALLLKINHPNIVKVLDYFIEQDRNYLMLDYVNGQDLRQLIKQNGPQKESTVINWALQMTNILKYLHEQDPPLIHRDFTPDNIVLCDDGSIVVIDFGAANEFIGNATGTFVGKHAFIAPEQFRGKAVVQSDIYALGCTLYFLLTGLEPEALSTSNPQDQNSRIAQELSEVVVSCTQLETRDRYQTAAQLVPVLRQMMASFPANT
jgi:tRNA A-37 threonylcarbamoyl transferase component Bud32